MNKIKSRMKNNKKISVSQAGLTLLELLIAISIVAILLTTVAPAIQSILITSRITADLNSLSAVAQRARFTAVDEQSNVVMCPTTNYESCVSNWKNATMIFVDENGNGSRDTSEPLITTSDPLNSVNTIYGISGAITFNEQGGISQAATITLCPKDNNSKYASALILSLYGRIAVAIDSDGDGTKEDLSGTDLSCS